MIATHSFAAAYRAKWVFTGRGEPLRDGFVIVADGRFQRVGRGDPGLPAIDLGDVAILPGLVNAHTHLEFSDRTEPISAGPRFPDWIRAVVEARRAAFGLPNPESLARAAVARGLSESLFAGTVLLGEIASPTHASEPFAESPVAAVTFSEILGVSPERGAAALAAATARLIHAARPAEREARPFPVPGISPHAPYTVPTTLLDEALAVAEKHRAPVAMHLAESPEEIELLATGRGPLRDALEALGAFDETRLALFPRVADYVERLAKCERALVVHANYVDAAAIDALARGRDSLSVVYCPRTHAHFGFERHPLLALREAGVRVVAGTDSRASNPDLSILAELREIARRFPELPGDEIVAMGTRESAVALGCGDSFGVIAAERPAHLVVTPVDPAAVDPHEALWRSEEPIASTMIAGAWSAGQISIH